jgi:uncharacterized protein (DUF2237 family)
LLSACSPPESGHLQGAFINDKSDCLRPEATRWQQALDAVAAPMVVLQATRAACLRIVKLADLKRYSVDLV